MICTVTWESRIRYSDWTLFVKTASRFPLTTNQNTKLEIFGNQSNHRIQGFMLQMTKISGLSIVRLIWWYIFCWYFVVADMSYNTQDDITMVKLREILIRNTEVSSIFRLEIWSATNVRYIFVSAQYLSSDARRAIFLRK